VFEPFYRLDRSRNVHTGGSGLGLAIVRQLCQAQGWRIAIEESSEGGAKFVLDL
jgi:signal transduction histidine kinase